MRAARPGEPARPYKQVEPVRPARPSRSCRHARQSIKLDQLGKLGNLYLFPAGYLKALERGNSVPKLKGFCEANKVNVFNVLSKILNFTFHAELIL